MNASIQSPAVWRARRLLGRDALPEAARCWLFDPDSLTRRLIGVCAGRFRVELLGQHRVRPLRHEAEALKLPRGVWALVREVYLLCDERPWVYARTVLPATTLTGVERRLAHLGTRPLGAVLFADPSMTRSEVEVARLTRRDPLFQVATARLELRPDSIYGRRSVFRLHGKPLLVSEIFLPGIPACPR